MYIYIFGPDDPFRQNYVAAASGVVGGRRRRRSDRGVHSNPASVIYAFQFLFPYARVLAVHVVLKTCPGRWCGQ